MTKLRLIVFLCLVSLAAMGAPFSYGVQMAGYAFDQYDMKGEITYERFVNEFREFPWKQQLAAARPGASSATLSVTDKESDTVLWVSIAGDVQESVFLLGIIHPIEDADKKVRWLDIYIAPDPKIVEVAFAMYFSGQIEKLKSEMKNLPHFESMEAAK